MLIDSHCHLDYFPSETQVDIVSQANTVGVAYMLNAGASYASIEKIHTIVNKFSCVFGAVGIHPHEAEKDGVISPSSLISKINNNKKIIAIGETGLDYSVQGFNKNIQIENLLNHIQASRTTDLPLIIHNRDSNEDMCDILSSEMKKSPFKAIIHCFTGDEKMANIMLDLGFYISASGIITFKNAESLRNVFKTIPLDKLLVETDSPYLAPVPYRSKENQPAFVVSTAQKLAEIKGLSLDKIADATTENFARFFKVNLD